MGWAIGDGEEHNDEATWDAVEAEELYNVLEQKVIPTFYERDDRGIPRSWIGKMRESMARLTPQFSASRTVREYTEKYYFPGAAAYRKRQANNGATGVDLVNWQHKLTRAWPRAHFGSLHLSMVDGKHRFQVELFLGELDQKEVRVELWGEGLSGEPAQRFEMTVVEKIIGSANGYLYAAEILGNCAPGSFTPRVVPNHPDAILPLEANAILWLK